MIPAFGFKHPEPPAGTFVFVGVGPRRWLDWSGFGIRKNTSGEVAVGAGMFVAFGGVGVKGTPINSLKFGAMNELIIRSKRRYISPSSNSSPSVCAYSLTTRAPNQKFCNAVCVPPTTIPTPAPRRAMPARYDPPLIRDKQKESHRRVAA